MVTPMVTYNVCNACLLLFIVVRTRDQTITQCVPSVARQRQLSIGGYRVDRVSSENSISSYNAAGTEPSSLDGVI